MAQSYDPEPTTSWAMQLGNLPAQPRNGIIRTYANNSRTFTRPYSAKTVFFYKEGDVYFTGVRVAVSKHRYKTMDNLYDELNHQIYMPFGVRHITTPMGRKAIRDLDELQHLGRYVASSSKPPRGVDLDVVEKLSAVRRSTRQSYWVPASPSLPARMRMGRMLLGVNMISAKQVFFVLNGKGKFYRTLINPMKLPTMEQLLEEVSTGLESAIYRFYTPDGQRLSTIEEILSTNTPKIIACPRNERPFMETKIPFKLPEIKPSRYAPRVAKTDSTSFSTSASTSTGSNGIEKREKMPPIRSKIAVRAVQGKRVSPNKIRAVKNANHWSRRKNEIATNTSSANSANDSGTGNSINSCNTSESDVDRPQSMTEQKARMMRDECAEAQNSDDPSEEDLILEEEMDYQRTGIDSGTSTGDESIEGHTVDAKGFASSLEQTDDCQISERIVTPSSGLEEAGEHRSDSRKSGRIGTPSRGLEEAGRDSKTSGRIQTPSSGLEEAGRDSKTSGRIQTPSSGLEEAGRDSKTSGRIQTPSSGLEEAGRDSKTSGRIQTPSSGLEEAGRDSKTSGRIQTPSSGLEEAGRDSKTSGRIQTPSSGLEEAGRDSKTSGRIQTPSSGLEEAGRDSKTSGRIQTPSSGLEEAGRDSKTSGRIQTPSSGLEEAGRDSKTSGRIQTPSSGLEEAGRDSKTSGRIQTPSSGLEEAGRDSKTSGRIQNPSSGLEEAGRDSKASRSLEGSPVIQTPNTGRVSSENKLEEGIISDDDHSCVQEKAAIKIQAVYRGFKTRKRLKVNFGNVEEIPNIPDETKIGSGDVEEIKNGISEEGASLRSASAGVMTYTIEVKIGFRYGADTEADLYLFLHGDEATSQRILLRQDSDWLLSPQTQFTEGSTVRFFVDSPILGTIHKLVIGHDRQGYGAGLFIEYIMIAENSVDGRQFYYSINKWFDGGQVDGKIERTCFLTTFLYLSAHPIVENSKTRGRWEFILHSRRDAMGGTTSNLTIVGYGDHDFTVNLFPNNLMMRDPSMNPLIQVDFGAHLGQLRKVRFEIDGVGENPNYFIEYVEIRDLDTDERSAHTINKWLIAIPEKIPIGVSEKEIKKFQPFREITIFQKLHMPLPLTTYEGKVMLADTKLCIEEPYPINLQLIGPNSQTGVFPVIPTKLASGKMIYTFKVEAVSLGAITEVRLVPRISGFGQDVLGGLQFLQEIYERHELPIFVGNDLFVHEISVRETSHAPFRHIFGHSEIHLDQNNSKGPYFKSLMVKVIEGLATTKKAGKNEKSDAPLNFLMFISVEEPENTEIPKISLLSKNGDLAEMTPVSENPTQEGVLTYQLNTSNKFGLVEKIRIGVDEIKAGKIAYVKKLRLVETTTLTEVRFVFFNELREFEIVEMMCVYPDVAPKLSISYSIQLKTEKSIGSFRPYLNLIGTDGDSGFRAYPGLTEFPDDTNVQMELESLKLGELQSIEMYLVRNNDSNKKKSMWKGVIRIAADEDITYATDTITIKKDGETVKSKLTLIQEDYKE